MAGAADLLVNQILDLADPGRRRCDTDGQLLARWVRDRDGRAFAALIARHGGLVWRVGRSVLPQAEDAEDVFQATFLVLARKAAALRKYSTITGWLYQTAYRLALKARTSAACRRRRENQAPTKATADPLEEISAREARTILAEELDRLSASYREPILLCLYQGATQDEAARQLGWSRRTLKRRLERARILLGQRLTRRGLAPATALALTLYSNSRAPAQLARATIAAATQFASGKAVTGSAALLAQGMLQTWLFKTMAGYLGIVVVLGSLTVAGGLAFLPKERNGGKQNLLLAAQATERPVKGEEEAPRLDVNGDPLPPGALARIGSNRLRHGGSVAAIAYLPDGKSIASSSTDGRLQLWDATTGKLRWHGKTDETRYLPALAVSGDGKKLAMLMSFEYELLATDTGKKLLQHQWPQEKNFDFVCCKAVAPNLETLARGCVDGTIRLHDAVSGKETVRIMAGDKARIRIPLLVTFSTDSKKICVLTRDKAALLVFDTKSGKAAQTLNIGKPLGGPFQLIHSQKHQLLALMDVNEVVVWDLATGKIRCIIENGVRAYSGAFSPDDSLIAIGRGASDIWVFDTATGKERQRLRTYRATQSLAFAPDGKTLASGDHGGAITLWDIPSGKPRFPSPAPKYISHFRFVNQGKEILSFGDNDAVGDSIDWWQVSSGRLLRHKDLMDPGGQRFNRYTLSVSPDAKLLAVDLADLRLVKADFPESKIVLMDCETGATVHTLNEDGATVGISAFSPDGTLLFTRAAKFGAEGVSNPHVTVWEVATGKLLRKMNTPVAVEKLEVSPNGRWIAGQSYTKGLGDYGISLWEVATGKLVHRLCPYPERTLALVFSADSSRLASVGNTTGRGFHGVVHLWDVATGKEVRAITGHQDVVTRVAIAPDGRTLATSSLDNSFRLWEIATGKERGRITGHEGYVGSMDFSPDSSILAAASSDAPIYLWNTYAVQQSKPTGANLTRKDREEFWEKLADDAADVGFQSICELIARPREAVAILEGAWKRIPRVTPQQMRKWITDLNSDQFIVRKTATAELERFGADHEDLLREALKQPGSLETRQRLEKILGRVNQERLRRGRMLEVLEHLHTDPSRRFLQELAEQREDSTMAREATAALERLAKLRVTTP